MGGNDSTPNLTYQNKGSGTFGDDSYVSAFALNADGREIASTGVTTGDYDNDGWLDIFEVNGHVYPQVDGHASWGTTFAQRPLLFHNVPEEGTKRRRFEYVPAVQDTGLAVVISARGAAFGDLFNDGKVDAVINPVDGPAVLRRNVNPDHHHWVEIKLVGGPKSPRDATCATA